MKKSASLAFFLIIITTTACVPFIDAFLISRCCCPNNDVSSPSPATTSFSTSSFVYNATRRRRRSSFLLLSAKKRKRKNRKNNNNKRKKNDDDDSVSVVNISSSNTGNHLEAAATQRPKATLAGVEEDHRFEQFFYDDTTANQLYQLVDRYERPLLMCNPTLAVLAEKDKNRKEYRLLDRDVRFKFLSGYREFSLTEPYSIGVDYPFDAVFIDPPFANVTPEQIAQCLRLIWPNPIAATNNNNNNNAKKNENDQVAPTTTPIPLYVAYNSRREEALLKAMNTHDNNKYYWPNLERKWSLSYKEGVSDVTQNSIWLYGPENVL